MSDAQLLYNIVESPEAKNLSGQALVDHITQKFEENNIPIDSSMQNYISFFSHNKRQCGAMNLMITNILSQRDPNNFHDMEAIGGNSGKSFIGDLLTDHRQDSSIIDKIVFVPGGLEADFFYKRLVNDFSNIHAGDSLVAAFPWLDNDITQDNSHITEVIYQGVENGKPYLLVFESNAKVDGVTGFRKIFDLNELVPPFAWEIRAIMYPDPDQAEKYVPIFGIVRYEDGK